MHNADRYANFISCLYIYVIEYAHWYVKWYEMYPVYRRSSGYWLDTGTSTKKAAHRHNGTQPACLAHLRSRKWRHKRIGATHTDTQLESAGARTPYNTGPGGKLDAASIGCESSAADFVTIWALAEHTFMCLPRVKDESFLKRHSWHSSELRPPDILSCGWSWCLLSCGSRSPPKAPSSPLPPATCPQEKRDLPGPAKRIRVCEIWPINILNGMAW